MFFVLPLFFVNKFERKAQSWEQLISLFNYCLSVNCKPIAGMDPTTNFVIVLVTRFPLVVVVLVWMCTNDSARKLSNLSNLWKKILPKDIKCFQIKSVLLGDVFTRDRHKGTMEKIGSCSQEILSLWYRIRYDFIYTCMCVFIYLYCYYFKSVSGASLVRVNWLQCIFEA